MAGNIMGASTGVLGAARVYGTPLSQEGIEDRAYRLHFNQVSFVSLSCPSVQSLETYMNIPTHINSELDFLVLYGIWVEHQ